MMTVVGFDKLCIYDVISRATTKKAKQRDILKNTVHKYIQQK